MMWCVIGVLSFPGFKGCIAVKLCHSLNLPDCSVLFFALLTQEYTKIGLTMWFFSRHFIYWITRKHTISWSISRYQDNKWMNSGHMAQPQSSAWHVPLTHPHRSEAAAPWLPWRVNCVLFPPFLFSSLLRTSLWNLEDPVQRKMIHRVRSGHLEHTHTHTQAHTQAHLPVETIATPV